MNGMKMKYTAIVAALMVAGMAQGEIKQQLRLHRKTITIYPVLLRQLEQEEFVVEPWRHGPGVAENLGVKLEQWGMLPEMSAEEFPPDIVGEDLTDSVKKPGAFPDKPLATDYALILLFEVKETETKPLVRAQAVMVDSSGRAVWVQRPGEFNPAGSIWPLALSHQITESLLPVSDLEKPATESDPGPFKTQVRKKYEARSKEGEKRYVAGLLLRRFNGRGQRQMEQEEFAGEVAVVEPDPRHVGRYIEQDNPSKSFELKADGSVVVKTSRHDIEGTFAVVKENVLVFKLPGHDNRSVGRIEGNKFISNVGDVSIKTEDEKEESGDNAGEGINK